MTIRFDALARANLSEVLARPRKRLAITHPGQFLLGEFMEPHELSANALANALHVPANRITAILKGQRGIWRRQGSLASRKRLHRDTAVLTRCAPWRTSKRCLSNSTSIYTSLQIRPR